MVATLGMHCVFGVILKNLSSWLLFHPAGNGLHPGGALAAGHPRPAAALLPLAGRTSAARDEELRNARQPAGQVRELAALLALAVFTKKCFCHGDSEVVSSFLQRLRPGLVKSQRLFFALLSGTSC